MRLKALTQLSALLIGLSFLGACSMLPMGKSDSSASFGLGKFTHFAGQEPGESYTTKAPSNQLYLFSYDESVVNPKYEASIYAQADYLRSHPNARVLLAGHTDERGSREYNIALGERRANAVAILLSSIGVSKHQYKTLSYGKEKPINYGHDEASHMQNRRVELTYEVLK